MKVKVIDSSSPASLEEHIEMFLNIHPAATIIALSQVSGEKGGICTTIIYQP